MKYIIASFLACSGVFLWAYQKDKNLVTACEIASMFHHGIVTVIGVIVAFMNRDFLFGNESVMGSNDQFVGATELQHINIGYFLYDTLHAVIWDYDFIAHHAICLIGFFMSEYTGCYALSNAVNTAVAESGSLMYNQYNKNKTLANLKLFVACYSVSRTLFTFWSFFVVYKSFNYSGEHVYPAWTPYAGTFLQLAILGVNMYFIYVHVSTLRERLKKGE